MADIKLTHSLLPKKYNSTFRFQMFGAENYEDDFVFERKNSFLGHGFESR